ncbi:MAG: hypothetical protein EZS28_031765 [Streblomastix strix]|uniref:Tyr recombinase domain-containing protein n=1 Tax=Streblomastix strix TaxID=222440 RepID=A0A5J4UQJ1_9EUKA|nr:MAG: hypothetical protein EZS28_031765 [Streblomastix strix]
MANYLKDAISQKCSDNSVKNQRCALAVLLKFMGYSEQQIHTDLQNLLSIEQRSAIAATLVMVFTVARLAELHRAVLFNTSEDEYIIQTTILKSPKRIAEFKICKIPDERICPLRWFKSWFADREQDIPNKAQELWRISHAERYIQAYDLCKAIRAVMQSSGISKTYLVTSIRAAAITKLLKYNVSSVKVDRFTHHSYTASTERQYYDKNNNVEAREVLGQTEEELDNEEDEEQERTLLEEIEHEIQCRIENTKPCWGSFSRLEPPGVFLTLQIPTEVVEDQKAKQDAANAEEVARLLDPFNIGRVIKQSKSQLSLQEVVYNPEEYKQSSGRDMSSSFVPPHQDVPTLGNLGQMERSQVQTQSSADEQHETPMIKEKETDDS